MNDLGTKTMVRGAIPAAPIAVVVRVVGPSGSSVLSTSFRLQAGSCTLGSGADCDVVIKHPTVSREHASLEIVAAGVHVRDLRSRNGTYYLGQRIERITLRLGATLMLGEAQIVVEPDTDALYEELDYQATSYGAMVGQSLAIRKVFGLLARLEGSLTNVLVRGESGVGKELVARAIHDGSRVAEGPFVALNCGAFSRDLVGSELFGHTRGAFSGAVEARKGAFVSAHGGTLFLDEIGELPLDVQPSLLRALEVGEIRALGSDEVQRVDVRVVCATHRDLAADIESGRFRTDLYYRLAVVTLGIPPLRERRDDIAPLAQRFARAADIETLPDVLLERFKGMNWPGNVRELRNAVDAFAALSVLPASPVTSPSDAHHIDTFVDTERPYLELRDALVDEFSRRYLRAILKKADDKKGAAAELAGLDRKYFSKLLTRYGL